jgi:hypothetical protein
MECRRIERCTHTQKHTNEHTANGKRKSEASEEKAKQAQKNTPQTGREKAKHAKDKFSGRASRSRSIVRVSLSPAIARLCVRVQFYVRQRKMAVMHQKHHASQALEKHFRTSIPKQTLTVPPGSSDSFFPLPGTRLPAIESVDSSVVCERNLVERVSQPGVNPLVQT